MMWAILVESWGSVSRGLKCLPLFLDVWLFSWGLKCLPSFVDVWLFSWGLKCLPPSFVGVWLFSWGLKCLSPFMDVWLFSCFGTSFHMSYPVMVAKVLSINSSLVIVKHSVGHRSSRTGLPYYLFRSSSNDPLVLSQNCDWARDC